MPANKKTVKASAKRFLAAIEEAAGALDALITAGEEDLLEELAEDLLETAADMEDGTPNCAWLEHVSGFLLIQAVKLDIAEEEIEEEEPDPDDELPDEEVEYEEDDDDNEEDEIEKAPPPSRRPSRAN
ncbi:hypothetical protein CCP2SC5_30093 [Azospirillaceae bacterium]